MSDIQLDAKMTQLAIQSEARDKINAIDMQSNFNIIKFLLVMIVVMLALNLLK